MRFIASVGERKATVDVTERGHERSVTVDGVTFDVNWRAVGGATLRALPGAPAGHYSLLVGGASFEVYVRAIENDGARQGGARAIEVTLDGRPYVVRLEDERTRALAGLAGAAHESGEATVTAPMPGLVANVLVAVGDTVERGQTVVVLEAMKMENDLVAPRAGVVHAILVARGQAVIQDTRLVVIGDAGGAPAADEDGE